MARKRKSPIINQTAIGDGNVQIAGDRNVVNQTIIQKFFNTFKSDAETTEQRNRRIMLNHVESFWVKGILEKSLHGAALLELGIKEDPDALNYPWTIKREATNETLPAGMSMFEIFQEIGMGRSLLILGAPGSGKTTMLLELTRQLIERAREDVTEPIPVVFNLSSWMENLSLADWLAGELNTIYSVPKKIAPIWVKENKMLLLLDGLDEVRPESRDKCVETINQFRNGNGLTSMVVCSRVQDYSELNARLFFDGAIEIQPLSTSQVERYLKSFDKTLSGVRQVLQKDSILREMVETPLFLSIVTLAYQDVQSKEILVSGNVIQQRKHLLDAYVDHMCKRGARTKNEQYESSQVLKWLAWLAQRMISYNQAQYFFENMQPIWLGTKKYVFLYRVVLVLIVSLLFVLAFGLIAGLFGAIGNATVNLDNLYFLEWSWNNAEHGFVVWAKIGCIAGLLFGLILGLFSSKEEIKTVDVLSWSWQSARKQIRNSLIWDAAISLLLGILSGIFLGISDKVADGEGMPPFEFGLTTAIVFFVLLSVISLPPITLFGGLRGKQDVIKTLIPGEKLVLSMKSGLFAFVIISPSTIIYLVTLLGVMFSLLAGFMSGVLAFLSSLVSAVGCLVGWVFGLQNGGLVVLQHYTLRYILSRKNFLPWKVEHFLEHCDDLIFLRRVGGGYIFVHRLLMEHFAAMYPEDNSQIEEK